MLSPYDRERKLMPILVEATVHGVRVDRDYLRECEGRYVQAVAAAADEIRTRLGAPGLNIGSGPQLAKALDSAGAVTEKIFTAKGNRSTKREVLEDTVSDPELKDLIIYHNTINKALSDFILKWLDFSAEDGRVHPNWNQVRSQSDSGGKGARTGRLSCDRPNLQNPPTEYELVVPDGFPPPPVLRRAFLPEEGHVWVGRDFSGQEMRVAAHFEDGVLLEAYIANPSLDPHELAKQMIHAATGLQYKRKDVKITGFQIIYGGGPGAVSSGLGISYEEGRNFIDDYFRGMPGIKDLGDLTRAIGRRGGCIRTWAGRRYYTEPPKIVNGRWRKFEYKLLNYLIQGSASDQTKDCIIHWYHEGRRPGDVFLATVHDEINLSVPEESWEESIDALRISMDRDLFDCPMRSEGYMGPTWGDVEKLAT